MHQLNTIKHSLYLSIAYRNCSVYTGISHSVNNSAGHCQPRGVRQFTYLHKCQVET